MSRTELIELLHRCAAQCNFCMIECLNEDDVSMMARCIELDVDCAELCSITAAFLARDSESSSTLAAVCGEVCQACADECAKHDADHCRKCAEVCAECAEACREL